MPLVKGSRLGGSVPRESELSIEQQAAQDPSVLQLLRQGAGESLAGIVGLAAEGASKAGQYFAPKAAKFAGMLPEDLSENTNYGPALARAITPGVEPKTPTQRFVRNIGAAIPGSALAFATGGSALPIGISAVGGALGETAAEEFGGGPIAQLIGGLAGSALGTKAFHKLQSRYGIIPQNLTATSEAAQKQLYAREKELGKDLFAPAKDYEKKLLHLEHRASKSGALPKSQKDDIIDKIQEALGDIKNGQINASQLVTRKQENNAFYKHFKGEKNKEAREYLDQIQKIIFEKGDLMGTEPTSIQAKQWRTAWKDADDITKALKFGQRADEAQEILGKAFEAIKSPIAKTIISGALGAGGTLLSGGSGVATGIVGTLGAAGYQGIRKSRYLANFVKQPATRKLLKDAAQYSLNRQIPQLTKVIYRLEKDAEQFVKKHPQAMNEARALGGPRGGGLVKGRKI